MFTAPNFLDKCVWLCWHELLYATIFLYPSGSERGAVTSKLLSPIPDTYARLSGLRGVSASGPARMIAVGGGQHLAVTLTPGFPRRLGPVGAAPAVATPSLSY